MKYSKLSLIFSIIPIINTILWVVLGMYFFSFTDRTNYFSIFALVDLVAMIIGCYYSIKSLREKNSFYKIIGISLSCIYIFGFLLMIIMNVIDLMRNYK